MKWTCICHEHKAECDCGDLGAPLQLSPLMRKAIIVGALALMAFFFAMAYSVSIGMN